MLTEMPLFHVIDAMRCEAERMSHFTLTGPAFKTQALEQVMSKPEAQTYKGRMEDALLHFVVGQTFTVEQLTGIAGRPETWGAHFNSVGAIVNGMARRGLIEKTGKMMQAQRPNMHATEIAEWRLIKYANVGNGNDRAKA